MTHEGVLPEAADAAVAITEAVLAGGELIDPVSGYREDEPLQRTRFRLADERAASWAARRLAGTRREIGDHEATFAAEVARLEAWAARVNGPLLAAERFFTALLEEYHGRLIGEEMARGVEWAKVRRKTLRLPWAVVKARRSPGRFALTDEDRAVDFLGAAEPDALYQPPPTVRASSVAPLVEEGRVFIDGDGFYWLRLAGGLDADAREATVRAWRDVGVEAEEHVTEDGEPEVRVRIPGIVLADRGTIGFKVTVDDSAVDDEESM